MTDGAVGPEVFIGMFQYLLVHGHSDEVHLLLDEEETQGDGRLPLMAATGSSKHYFPRGSIQSVDVASAVPAEEEEEEEPLLMEPSGRGWADCFTWCAPCFVPPPRSRPRPGWIAGLLPPAMDDGEEPEMPSSSGRFLLEIGYMKRFHWVHDASSSQQVQCVHNPRTESIYFGSLCMHSLLFSSLAADVQDSTLRVPAGSGGAVGSAARRVRCNRRIGGGGACMTQCFRLERVQDTVHTFV